MSILIKGVDIPKTDAQAIQISYWTKDGHYIAESYPTSRIVEIPTPHGRIIDIDKVKDELRDQIPCCGLDMTYSNSNAFDTMDNAPTILEEEE